MIYSNSIKILFTNFVLGAKSLLYKLIAVLISCATIFSIAFRPLQVLKRAGVFSVLWKALKQPSFFKFFDSIISAEKIVIDTLKSSSTSISISLVFAIIIGYFLFSTICSFDKIPLCDALDCKMSSNLKISFTGELFSRLWVSIKFTLASFLVFLPFDILFLFTTMFAIRLFTFSGFLLTIAPFVVILDVIIFFSLRLCFASSWAPCLVNSGRGVWASFAHSVKLTCKKFIKTFANCVLVVLTLFFFNMMMFVLTAGVGFVVTIPASVLFVSSFSMVNYYVLTGNRFYVDAQTIISPRKLETQDEVKNLIDII